MNGRELYFYWRIAPAQRAEAVNAARRFQAAACAGRPGLQARLLVKADGSTLMEVYRCAAGIDDATLDHLVAEGDAASARWRSGERHCEVFGPPG